MNNSTAENRIEKKKRFRIVPFIVSLLLAFILWNYVMMVESPTREVTFDAVPITIIKGENPLAVISGGAATVNVTVSGKKSLTNKLTNDSISVIADISDIAKYPAAGEYSKVPVRVEVPTDVTLVGQSANYVTLYLDEMSTKSFPITVDFPGSRTYDNGCELGTDSVELSQSEINVSGPTSVISRIDHALLTIPLSGHIQASTAFSGTPSLVDSDGKEVINSYLTTDVTGIFGTVPLFMTKEVPLTVDFKYDYFNNENVSVKIDPASVQVRGKIEDIASIESYTVTTVDEKKFTKEFTATLTPIDGVTVLNAPESVSVNVNTRGYSEKTLILPISVEGSSYTLDKDSISVTFMGEREAMALLTAESVSASVDLGGVGSLGGGIKQTVPVTVTVSGEFNGKVWEKGEYTVLVSEAGR